MRFTDFKRSFRTPNRELMAYGLTEQVAETGSLPSRANLSTFLMAERGAKGC